MKKKAILVFSLVFWILGTCAFLSIKTEELMTPYVETKKVDSFENDAVAPLDCLKIDDSGFHLYSVYEGSGWEKGYLINEISADTYTFSDNGIILDYGNEIVEYSSRPFVFGDTVKKAEGSEKENDIWLAVSSDSSLQDNLPDKYQVIDQKENAYLISVSDVTLPFMEDKARSTLFEYDFVATEHERVYSLNDIERFLYGVKLVTIVPSLAIFILIIWVCSVYLSRDLRRNKMSLIINAVLSVLALAAVPGIMHFVDLPGSMLPREIILDIGHYRTEMTDIISNLSKFTTVESQEIFDMIKNCEISSLTIVFSGLLAGSLIAFSEIRKKKA